MTTHGCLAPCPTCRQGCPICHPCKPECSSVTGYKVHQPRLFRPLKCDLCGSTAIDHTESRCQMNRQLKDLRRQRAVTDLASTDPAEASSPSNPPKEPHEN